MLFYEDEPDTIEMTPASTRNSTLADSRNQAIDPLTQYGPFAFIPYLPSSSPITSQPAFHLNNTSTWTYCGPILSPTSATNLPPSFSTWASATISSPPALVQRLLPLLSFLNTFLEDAGARHYWLTIRATKPTSEYDTPRWHVDEDFFEMGMGTAMGVSNSGAEEAAGPVEDETQAAQGLDGANKTSPRRWKLATTLHGPSTLFQTNQSSALETLRSTRESSKHTLDISSHTCTSIRCLGCSTYASHVRCCLASRFSSSPTTSSTSSEISFFRIGQTEGAVHSEPKCDVERVFVNVVPGTEGELKELMGRWGMVFPRAWCFGVPVNFGLVGMKNDDGECGEGKEESISSSSSIKDSRQDTRSVAESKLETRQDPTNDDDDGDNDDNDDDEEGNYNEPQTQQQYQPPPLPLLSPSSPETKNNNTSTMTANLSLSYTAWLSRNGLNVEKVFGAG